MQYTDEILIERMAQGGGGFGVVGKLSFTRILTRCHCSIESIKATLTEKLTCWDD